MIKRSDKFGNVFIPFVEEFKGIAVTNRSGVIDSKKWSSREHVGNEDEAAKRLKLGWHLWMEREDGSSKRPSLITPTSIVGWR